MGTEEDEARQEIFKRNLEKIKRKKEREKEERKQKEKAEKASLSRKRKPSTELVETSSKSAVMSSLLAKVVDIKCEPNSITATTPTSPPKVAKPEKKKLKPEKTTPPTPPRPAPEPKLTPELKKKSSSTAVS